MPPTGDLACKPGMCPDWNQTSDPLLRSMALNPLSHTSQGWNCQFIRTDEMSLVLFPQSGLLTCVCQVVWVHSCSLSEQVCHVSSSLSLKTLLRCLYGLPLPTFTFVWGQILLIYFDQNNKLPQIECRGKYEVKISSIKLCPIFKIYKTLKEIFLKNSDLFLVWRRVTFYLKICYLY